LKTATFGRRADETVVAGFLRRMARERAKSVRWDANIAITFYVLFVIVLFLRLGKADTFLVTALAAAGLAGLWTAANLRAKRLEKRLFREEVEYYCKIISGETPGHLLAEPEMPASKLLSKREIEVLGQIACGLSNKEIAVALGISAQTVKNHISHILTKLEVGDRTSAVLIGITEGWISGRPRPAVARARRISGS